MADEMTEAVQQTTEARVDSTIDTRRENPMKVRPRSLQFVVVKVMGVMDDRGMLRQEQNRGWGAKGVLNASGIRKYL